MKNFFIKQPREGPAERVSKNLPPHPQRRHLSQIGLMINLFGLVSNTTERRTKTEKEKSSPWPIVLTSAKKTPEGYIYKGCFNNYYRRISRDTCVLIFIGASIFLRQKKMDASVWRTWRRKTRRKRDKKKSKKEKQPLLTLF